MFSFCADSNNKLNYMLPLVGNSCIEQAFKHLSKCGRILGMSKFISGVFP